MMKDFVNDAIGGHEIDPFVRRMVVQIAEPYRLPLRAAQGSPSAFAIGALESHPACDDGMPECTAPGRDAAAIAE